MSIVLIKTRKLFNFKIVSNLYIQKCRLASKDQIKQLNFANKALYGEVVKKSKKLTKTQTVESSAEKPAAKNNNSEIYWLTQQNKQETYIKGPKSTRKIIKINKNARFKDSKLEKETGYNAIAPNSIHQFNETSSKISIPFDNNQLKDLLAFPLYSNKTIIAKDYEQYDCGPVPSVGKILQSTMPESSRLALQKWKLLKIAELGEDGFNELQKSHLTAGSMFHTSLQTYFATKEKPTKSSPLAGLWTSVCDTIETINSEPELVEAPIVHPALHYKGIVDCVSIIDSNLTIIEWKKSDKAKASLNATYDAPLQLCAYLGAINADKRYHMTIRNGLIVIAYTDGRPANVFTLNENNLRNYWQAWLLRLHEYWVRARDGTLPEPI